MNAILGFSELIKSKAFGDAIDKYTEYAGIIHESGEHLLQLINDMLDLAKIEGGKLTLRDDSFAIAKLIGEVAEEHQERALAGDLTLNVTLAPGLPQIDADERAIRNILTNLLSNALKFTPPGGAVTMSAQVESDGRLCIAVDDTGIGIAPEDQLQVFERFGRGRHDVTVADKGTGLGLAIVKGFAEAHDGEVTLESEPGVGTRVTCLSAGRAPAHPARLADAQGGLSREDLAQRRVALQVMVDIAVERIEHGQPLEVMADIEFVGHAHAAMKLHRLLADEAAGLADLHLGRRGRLLALDIALVELERDHQRDRGRLLVVHEHVDHAVLQHLELADRHAELLARLGVFDRGVEQHLHRADRFGGMGGDGFVGHLLDQAKPVIGRADDSWRPGPRHSRR